MRTSQEWWNETKADPVKLINWLKEQYHGERTAAIRIVQEFSKFKLTKKQANIIQKIAAEEDLHADWIDKLLLVRGELAQILDKKEPYWEATLIEMDSIKDVAAIAHHAELMRLERIRVIAADEAAPADIREVFQKILPMEEVHEKLFASLSSEEFILKHQHNHEAGKQALGLVI